MNIHQPTSIKPNQSERIRLGILEELNGFTSKDSKVFPVDAFPPILQHLINEAHTKLNFPPDFLGSSILYAASVAIGNTFRLEVKKGFTTSAVVWIALVGRPGVNKSHPLKFAIQPILNRDNIAYQQYAIDCETYAHLEGLNDKQLKELGYEYLPSRPVLKKNLVQDFTPEALATLHKTNPRSIGIYVDELIGWVNNFNRYNKGSDQETALQLWSGHPLSVDRKNSPSIYIPQPYVPVIGTIQPDILTSMLNGKGNGNGFLDRFLFAAPSHLKKEAWSDEEMNEQLVQSYHQVIDRLFELPLIEYPDTYTKFGTLIKLDTQARADLFEWQHRNADITNETNNEALRGYYNKMDIHVPRLILLVHLLNCVSEGERDMSERLVGRAAVKAGIAIAEYFRGQAEETFDNILHVIAVDRLSVKDRIFYESLPSIFKRKEILSLTDDFGIAIRTMDRMLSNRELFAKSRNGEYEKLF